MELFSSIFCLEFMSLFRVIVFILAVNLHATFGHDEMKRLSFLVIAIQEKTAHG